MPVTYSAYGYFDSRLANGLLGFNGESLDFVLASYMLGQGIRRYSPTLMRFASADHLSPFGKAGNNAYVYCAGDPVNFIDPSGATRQFPGVHKVPTPSTRFKPTQRKAPGLAVRQVPIEEAPPNYNWALARTPSDDPGAPPPPPYRRSPSPGQSTNVIRLDGHDVTSPITSEQFQGAARALTIQDGTINMMINGGPINGNYEAFGKAIVAANVIEARIALARVALHHRRNNTATQISTIRNT